MKPFTDRGSIFNLLDPSLQSVWGAETNYQIPTEGNKRLPTPKIYITKKTGETKENKETEGKREQEDVLVEESDFEDLEFEENNDLPKESTQDSQTTESIKPQRNFITRLAEKSGFAIKRLF